MIAHRCHLLRLRLLLFVSEARAEDVCFTQTGLVGWTVHPVFVLVMFRSVLSLLLESSDFKQQLNK